MMLRAVSKIPYAWKHAATVVGLLLISAPLHAQFVSQNFRNSVAPEWTLTGMAELTANAGIDPEGGGWLRLTENVGYERGGALYQNAFSSTDGIVVKFDYVMWDKGLNDAYPADGISFFLYDASVQNPMDGATNGAGLGYCNGLGGVLGIGLDSGSGSFVMGRIDNSFCLVGEADGRPNTITVRGPLTADNAIVGTPQTPTELIYNPLATSRPAQTRSVQLSMVPLAIGAGHYITVDEGPTGSILTRIIEGNYAEELPANLSIGFGGGTGSSSQVNEVRINNVTKPIDVLLTTTPPVQSGQNGYTVTHTFTLENQPLQGGAAVPITDPSDAPLLSEVYPPDLSNIRWTCTPSGNGTTCPADSGAGPIENLGGYLLGADGSLTFTVSGTVRCSTDSLQTHTVTAVFPNDGSYDDVTPADSIASANGQITTSGCPAPQPVPFLGHFSLLLLSLIAAGLGVLGLNRRITKA